MKTKDNFDFEEKYNLYSSMIYKISATYLGNKHDAEDAMQEVFIKMAYKAPRFINQEEEKAWIIRVTINQCKNIIKSVWKKRVIKTDDLFVSSEDSQNEISIFNDIISLGVKEKEVMFLYYIEGYKINEISKILKLSDSCIKMRLSRAKNSLKNILEVNDDE